MNKISIVIATTVFLFLLPLSAFADVSGHYSGKGATVKIQLKVSEPVPAAFIVQQPLPRGVQLKSARPSPSGYTPGSSAAKWFFKHPRAGSITLSMQLAGNLPSNGLQGGVIRYRLPGSNKMVSRTIR